MSQTTTTSNQPDPGTQAPPGVGAAPITPAATPGAPPPVVVPDAFMTRGNDHSI